MKTIRLTKKQAKWLLNNIPTGKHIKITIADANKILGKQKGK